MLEIHLNKLIKQNIYKTTNQIQRNVLKEYETKKWTFKWINFIYIKVNKIKLISFKDNLLSSFPFLQNWKKNCIVCTKNWKNEAKNKKL